MEDNTILLAEVRRKPNILDGDNRWNARLFAQKDKETVYITNYVSYDKNKLKEFIENRYDVSLIMKDDDEFPWFTDGGFKYYGENERWKFEVTAYVQDIII